MDMAITRINNNQITDSVAGNIYLGVNAAVKIQDFTVTAGKIANNLTYNSDLTVTGNLTVQGNTTTIDTVNLVVEDPLILLAKEQTGAPALDIGFIGKRGTEDNIAFVWDESADQFVAVFTTSEVTNSIININSYASLQVLDLTAANANITGNISFTGNVIGPVTVVGNVDANNFNATSSVTAGTTITATGNVSGGNVTTAGVVAATGNVSGGNITTAGVVAATGNVSGGNLTTVGVVAATGNVSGGNITTAGAVDATGNVSGGNITTVGNVDGANVNATSGITAGTTIVAIGNVSGGNITTAGEVAATGNVSGGNLVTGGVVAATGNVSGGNITTAGNVAGGNINATANVTGQGAVFSGNVTADNFIGNISGNIDAGGANTNIQFNDDDVLSGSAAFTFDKTSNLVTATGNISAGNLVTGGLVEATGNVSGGNITTAGVVSATGNVSGGNITTAGVVAATGNVSGGNLTTAGNVDSANVNATGTVIAIGNVSGGNLTTAGVVAATGNVSGGNITTAGEVTATGNVSGGNLTTAGVVAATGNVSGGNITTAGEVTATGNVSGLNINSNSIVGGDIVITATSVDMNLTGNLIMSGRYINQVADPVAAQDAATKQYVDDAVSSGIHIHTPVDVETPVALPAATYNQGGTTATVTDTIAGNTVVFSTAVNPQVNDQLWFTNSFNGVVANIAYFVVSAPNTSAAVVSTQYNGTPVSNISNASGLTESVRINSGFGANLVANTTGALTVDGYSVSAGNRVLVYNQSNAVENGIYVVSDAGNGSASWVLTRSDDANSYIPDSSVGLDEGTYVYIKFGDTGAGESYVMTAPQGPFNIGQAAVTFTQFSASQVYSANTQAGLVLNGTIFSAKVDNDTTAFDGGGNISVKVGANLVTPNIGNAVGNSLTLTGNANVANLNASEAVIATGNVTGGNITTAGVVAATGNVSGGNLNTAGVVTATGNVTGGNIATAGVVTATGNVSGGNLVTGGVVAATGNVSGGNITTAGNVDSANVNATGTVIATGNVAGGNLTTAGSVVATGNVTGGNLTTAGVVAATGNVSGGNLTTAGVVAATGNVSGGNISTAGVVTATGNVSGGNITTAGEVAATGNITGGNLSAGAGIIETTGNINGGNINATANVTGQGAVFSGNVTADNFIGNISGNIDAGGANTNIQFNDNDVLAGSAAFTFDKTSNLVTASGNISAGNLVTGGVVSATGNVSGGNLTTAGTVVATGNVDGGNVNAVSAVTAGTTITATGNVAGGNITTAGAVDATGNITGGNIVTTGTADLGNIRITGNDITNFASNIITINSAASDIDVRISGDTVANLLLTDAGTDTVVVGGGNATTGAALKIDTTDSMMVPVGNTLQRPGTPEIGMFRFNTGGDALEVYTSGGWEDVGVPAFTVIIADAFVGNGVQTIFTLSANSTTAGTIVAINGVVQEPTTAYSVSNDVLTFTEAPAVSDNIDARILTTTTTVTSIDNISGNAVVEVLDTADTVQITGNLLPVTSNTYNLGSNSLRWKELWLQGSTINLGNVVIKNTSGNTIGFFGPDGTTPGSIDTNNIDSAGISNGTSSMQIIASGGNIRANIAGATVQTISTTGVAITGDLSVTGNATLSGNILGDRIQNGTTQIDIQTQDGNANITVGGVSNVAVFSSTGANITGTLNATGNANVGNLGTAGLVSATGNVTGGNLTTAGLVSAGTTVTATGNVTGGNLTTAGVVSATGNVSGANLLLTGNIFDSGTSLQINTTTAANIALAPNSTIVLVATTTGANITGTLNATGNANVGNLGTAGLVSATGNVSGGNLITAGLVSLSSITKTGSNGVGNIGSSTSVFDTVFAKATSAQYADLAEMYEADAEYEPGTVLCFGGVKEVTVCGQADSFRVAGVVSTNPSYLMNSGQAGEHVAAVALTGRVPCRVTGTIHKGDLIVSTGDGRGRANNAAAVGTVIGKALADFEGADGVIEVVVGRV
jgi:filamentous hemagglutinin